MVVADVGEEVETGLDCGEGELERWRNAQTEMDEMFVTKVRVEYQL